MTLTFSLEYHEGAKDNHRPTYNVYNYIEVPFCEKNDHIIPITNEHTYVCIDHCENQALWSIQLDGVDCTCGIVVACR